MTLRQLAAIARRITLGDIIGTLSIFTLAGCVLFFGPLLGAS